MLIESDVTSIILAGGHSSRLGREKSAEPIAGKTLIGQTISRLSLLGAEMLIVISHRQSKLSFSSYNMARAVVDIYPEKGSLGGIYTGLMHSTTFHNLVVACDMPFLNLVLLRYMIDIAPGYDVVIPRIGNLKEPLHAIYTKNCLLHIEKLLNKGALKIANLFDSVKVRYIEENEINKFDPAHLSFFNINTEADLEKARMLAFPQKT